MSGPTADWGRAAYRGAGLAVEYLNTKGTPARLLPEEDNRGEANDAAEAMRRLVSLRGAQAVVGPVTSPNARSAAKVADELKTPFVSVAATDVGFTRVSPYAFRPCFSDDFQGRILATVAHEQLKSTHAAVLFDPTDAYSAGLANAFKAAFVGLGGRTTDFTISVKDREFGPQIEKIRATGAQIDLVFMPANYPPVAAFLRQARRAKLASAFLTADGAHSPELFRLAGEDADGIWLTSHFAIDSDVPEVRAFVDSFSKRYSEPPNVAAALAYDAVLMIGQGFAQMKPGESLREAMSRIKGLAGVTGTISLDENRDPMKSVIVLKTAGQKFYYVRTVKP